MKKFIVIGILLFSIILTACSENKSDVEDKNEEVDETEINEESEDKSDNEPAETNETSETSTENQADYEAFFESYSQDLDVFITEQMRPARDTSNEAVLEELPRLSELFNIMRSYDLTSVPAMYEEIHQEYKRAMVDYGANGSDITEAAEAGNEERVSGLVENMEEELYRVIENYNEIADKCICSL